MTGIPMKFAIPILAVVALPLVYALYNFSAAPASTQEQIDGKEFVATLRAANEDPCTHAAWKTTYRIAAI
jgi:hypothetical protein